MMTNRMMTKRMMTNRMMTNRMMTHRMTHRRLMTVVCSASSRSPMRAYSARRVSIASRSSSPACAHGLVMSDELIMSLHEPTRPSLPHPLPAHAFHAHSCALRSSK